ncbi:MAG: phospholipase D family protein [Thermoplasmataceae archaeon]
MPGKDISDLGFSTFIVNNDTDLEAHFSGFKTLKAVSYVVSLRWILEFLEKKEFESIEILVGKEVSDLNPAEILKDEMGNDKGNLVHQILGMIEQGRLLIYTSDRIIHSKFYILTGNRSTRVIQGSANLTTSARKGKQVNYLWEWTLRPGSNSNLMKRFNADYELHKKYCTLFMRDLQDMLSDARNEDRERIINNWLGRNVEPQEIEIMPLLTQMVTEVLASDDGEPVYRMILPSEPSKRKPIEQILQPIKYKKESSQIVFLKKDFLSNENLLVPIMRVNFETRRILFNIKSEKFTVGDITPSGGEVNGYLADLEEYIKSTDMGKTRNKTINNMTKMSMYEGVIYFLSSPFMNEYMKIKRAKVGRVDERGPRFLFISGGSSNGKTTFIKYALKLLTGKDINPIDKSNFKKQNILTTAGLGTNFPLVFDDVPPQRLNSSDMETTIKSYWETWWSGQSVFPTIIVSSNAKSTKEWYQTRVKTLNFDVHFEPSMKARERLNEIFTKQNNIFSAFALFYFRNFNEDITDDELELGRGTMLRLYDYAGRPVPEYFPRVPIESIYDPDRLKWQELIGLGKVGIVEKNDSLEITFLEGFNRSDVEHYADSIKHAKHRIVGNTIVIESPEDFRKWLDLEKKERHGLLGKLFGRGGK